MSTSLSFKSSKLFITVYYEIIHIRWTFSFKYFMGKAICEFKIPVKYLYNFIILDMI